MNPALVSKFDYQVSDNQTGAIDYAILIYLSVWCQKVAERVIFIT